MLDSAIKEQLRTIFAALEANYTFDITVSPQHESRTELLELLNDVASCSEKLSCRINEGKGLEFTLLKENTGQVSPSGPFPMGMNSVPYCLPS